VRLADRSRFSRAREEGGQSRQMQSQKWLNFWSSINLSKAETWRIAQNIPTPTGRATASFITEYDLPKLPNSRMM